MTTAVLVIHGLESTAPNATAQFLNLLNTYKVISPQIDHRDFTETKKKLDDITLDLLNDQEVGDIVVVGSSMGGFWAHYLCKKYNLKTVLVNPVLRIERITADGNGFDPVDKMLYRDLSLNYEVGKYKPGTYVDILLGGKDDIIDPMYAIENFPSCTVLENEGHRIQNTKEIINMIIAADNNLSC